MTTPLKFTKVDRGWYATEDGRWAVVVDGYAPSQSAGRDAGYDRHVAGTHNLYEGFVGGEWAVVYHPDGGLREEHNDGENLDWFPTKREAVACAQREAARRQPKPVAPRAKTTSATGRALWAACGHPAELDIHERCYTCGGEV